MKVTLADAMKLTLGNEGNWYDGMDPRDPNPTMYGVTQARYNEYRASKKLPNGSVRYITGDQLEDIYESYWVGTCDFLAERFPLTALCLFDMAINGGITTARHILQRSIDLVEDGDIGDIWDDGNIGPQTLHLLNELFNRGFRDEHVCLWVLMERVRHYDNLATSQRLRPNLKSWLGRTVGFYDKYLRIKA